MQGQLCNIDWLLMAKIFSPLLVLILAAVILLIKDAIPSDSDEEAGDSFALVILSAALLAAFSLSWMMWPTADDLAFGPFSVGKSCLAIWMIIFIVTGISALTALPSKVAIRREADSYFAFILIAAASYCLAVSSNDILMIFVSMEIAGVSSYATVAARSDNSYSLEGALKYFISAAFAAAFFMMGMAFIFG
ncbi:MAG TPA: proton-conducting transporter membrane subunit, partial [bacterium]|nr:proton-conducting transporter membrane subunit [bacterium]